MKGYQGRLLGALLLVVASMVPSSPARAQIILGTYVLLQHVAEIPVGSVVLVEGGASLNGDPSRWRLSSSYHWPTGGPPEQGISIGRLAPIASFTSLPRIVGIVRVPPHDDPTLPYEEHWLLFPEYRDALEEGEHVTIVPLHVSPAIADQWMEAAAAREDVTYRHVLAQREELSDDADEDETGNPCDVSEAASETDFRGIWQRKGLTPDVEQLVGFVRRSSTGRDTGEEQWCLTVEYTYPNVGDSTLTDLRSATREDLAQVVVQIGERKADDAAPHRIRVETTDYFGAVDWSSLTEPSVPLPSAALGAAQAHACHMGRDDSSPLWCFVAGFIGIAFSLRRAQDRRRGPGR